PLVNPIRIAGTPFSIDFSSRPPILDVGETQIIIAAALEQIEARIRYQGNGPIRSDGRELPLEWGSRTLHLSVNTYAPPGTTALTYRNAAVALELLKLKLAREGYLAWLGKIFESETSEARLTNSVLGYVNLRRTPVVPPKTPQAAEAKARRQLLRPRDVLPSPYPVPDTAFTIDFDQNDREFPALPAADVDSCISYALETVIKDIRREGDGPISSELDIDCYPRNLQLTVTSFSEDVGISYNDTIAIMTALSLKMRRDGYRARFGEIVAAGTGNPRGEVWLQRLTDGEVPRERRDDKNISTLRLEPMPNPYPLPSSPYSIDFFDPDTQASPLPASEVRICISRARAKIAKQLTKHGDGPLPFAPVSFLYHYRSVYLLIGTPVEPADRRLKYSDALAVVAACAMKTAGEGYHSRVGDIFNTATDEWKGDVAIGAYQQTQGVGKGNKTELGRNPMPNPYPLPNTNLLLDFEEPGMPLPVADVQECFLRARQEMLRDIARYGEGSLIPPSVVYRWGIVEFRIFPEPRITQRHLNLGELQEVLTAYALKSIREGHRSRWGRIVVAGGEELIVAEALLHARADAEGRDVFLDNFSRDLSQEEIAVFIIRNMPRVMPFMFPNRTFSQQDLNQTRPLEGEMQTLHQDKSPLVQPALIVDAAGPLTHAGLSSIDRYVCRLVCLDHELQSGDRRRARDDTLPRDSMPNPYPMPYTPYSIAFDEDPGEPLSETDAKDCLHIVRQKLLRYIRAHGGNHDLEPCEYRYNSVRFRVTPFLVQTSVRHLTFFDLNAVIAAFSLKLTREGYRPLAGRIFMTMSGRGVGTALLAPAHYSSATASS
ncbi:MAG: hypothetical protein Q9173_003447, partial [Seirophora scorigena]